MPIDHWDGDVNEAVLEEWVEETTPFERVREVLLSTTEPQYAKDLAVRARVSEPTARKHLGILAAEGVAETVETGHGTRYKRSRQSVAVQRISDLHKRMSREELTSAIEDLRGRIRRYQEEYDATDPDDLALQLESDDSEAWAVVPEWRAVETDLRIAQAALALYGFDPDSDEGGEADGGSRGSFAGGNDSGATV